MNLLTKAAITTMNIFAKASADPTKKGKDLLNKWIGYSKDFGWIIAILCVVIVGIMFMIPSEEQHRNAKKFAIFILVGAAIISVGPAIIDGIKSAA